MNDVLQNIIHLVVTFLFSLLFLMTAAALLSYLDRKVQAWTQDRYGPLHNDPHGILQAFLDDGKLLLQEALKPPASSTTLPPPPPIIFFPPHLPPSSLL